MKEPASRFQKPICLVFAFIASVCTPYALKDTLANFSLGNSLFSLLVFFAYYCLLQCAVKHLKKAMIPPAAALGFLFSAFMIVGKNIYTTGVSSIMQLKTWGMILAFFPVFFGLVVLCFRYLPLLCAETNDEKHMLSDKKRFFVVWLLIFLAWLPVLLASYPGVYGYDSVYQINYYRSGVYLLKHPIAHTYLLGFFVITLGELLGSYEAGMCCYAIFQMACLSAALSTMYCVYISKRYKKSVSFAVLLLFMFFPTNALMAISATKDVLFSAFFALGAMLLLMLAENPERLKSAKFDAALTAIVFLLSIFRNQGKYVVIGTFLVSILLLWKYRKQLLLILAAFLVLLSVYNGPVTTALNGKPANSLQEMMSIPCLQLSRVGVYGAKELTEEEILEIEEYIGRYDEYPRYEGISDSFKGSLDTEKVKEDPLKFVRLWVKTGLSFPVAYLDAFARVTIGYWYPDMNYRDPYAYHPYWEYAPTGAIGTWDAEKYLLLKQTPVKGFEALHDWLYDLSYSNTYQSLPVIPILFSAALPIWCFLIVFAYTLYKKQYQRLIPHMYLLLFIVTLLLGPVVLYRYVYPLHLAMPLFLCCGENNNYRKAGKKYG